MFVLFVMRSYLIEVRGLKRLERQIVILRIQSYLIEVRGLKHCVHIQSWPYLCRIL